jgi:phosphatidylglycerol:prolipoprotein diacylglycerol transferase
MVFPAESPAGYCYPGQPIHPAQLYSSFYGLIIFVSLLLLERYKKFDGFLLYCFFILYGVSRFIVDFFRYYENSMVIGGLSISVNQGISLLMIILGIILVIMSLANLKKAKNSAAISE